MVEEGARAELTDCSLALTADGQACSAVDRGTSVVLRGGCVEGCSTTAGRTRAALSALRGGSLALEGGAVDVGRVPAAVTADGPGGLGLGVGLFLWAPSGSSIDF
jgi:hypothetical protein